eukprot:CAMPEP_0206225822 /NCGR_PEP_ID=MMETSP0047_2-20121206/7750_1 /ASSEMBLY_ACC=CAM_ASM_000192 /TAXON_ID=195065 /ORGANISM="Chroomonas mesostigmatica_cf, Strain CCMP1168" /LENGTH=159 /DNA_ID=CAMNT_0053648843 /DNA_START=688 /DNA_END=1166 /DNA_ORIENTATION=-
MGVPPEHHPAWDQPVTEAPGKAVRTNVRRIEGETVGGKGGLQARSAPSPQPPLDLLGAAPRAAAGFAPCLRACLLESDPGQDSAPPGADGPGQGAGDRRPPPRRGTRAGLGTGAMLAAPAHAWRRKPVQEAQARRRAKARACWASKTQTGPGSLDFQLA